MQPQFARLRWRSTRSPANRSRASRDSPVPGVKSILIPPDTASIRLQPLTHAAADRVFEIRTGPLHPLNDADRMRMDAELPLSQAEKLGRDNGDLHKAATAFEKSRTSGPDVLDRKTPGRTPASFKCGHDAPIYGVIEGIIEKSGTPYFSFKDMDENKPTGSIKIRVETIDYFLRRYREDVIKRRKMEREIDAHIVELAHRLESPQNIAVAV